MAFTVDSRSKNDQRNVRWVAGISDVFIIFLHMILSITIPFSLMCLIAYRCTRAVMMYACSCMRKSF